MISGVRVGRVVGLSLLEPTTDSPPPAAVAPDLGRQARPVVRTTLDIEAEVAQSLARDSLVHVGTQGLIGESYLELTPGKPGSGAIVADQSIRGVDAPRLHVMALQVSALLSVVGALIGSASEEEADLGEMGEAVASLLKTVNALLGDHKAELGGALNDLAASAADAKHILAQVRQAVGDGPLLRGLVADSAESVRVLRDELPRLLAKARASLTALEGLSTQARGAIDPEALARIVEDAQRAVQRLDEITRDGQALLHKIRGGEGTLGGLVQDPQIYDDLKELLRDLKQHPWKFMWRD